MPRRGQIKRRVEMVVYKWWFIFWKLYEVESDDPFEIPVQRERCDVVGTPREALMLSRWLMKHGLMPYCKLIPVTSRRVR